MKDGLHSRFRKEQLADLVHNGQKRGGSLKIGDIVLIGTDNVNRTNLRSGKLVELFLGKDGNHRLARVNGRAENLFDPS